MQAIRLLLLLAPALLLASSVKIEQRDEALWPTANFLRFRQPDSTPKGRPVWVDTDLPAKFNPDSVRVLADGSPIAISSKTEWRARQAGRRIVGASGGDRFRLRREYRPHRQLPRPPLQRNIPVPEYRNQCEASVRSRRVARQGAQRHGRRRFQRRWRDR